MQIPFVTGPIIISLLIFIFRTPIFFYMGLRGPKRSEKSEIICQMYESVQSYSQLGRLFGMSRQRVHQIVRYYRSGRFNAMRKRFAHLRDNPCQECGGKANHLHHKDFNNRNDVLENLMPVCEPCHKRLHTEYRRNLNGFIIFSAVRVTNV